MWRLEQKQSDAGTQCNNYCWKEYSNVFVSFNNMDLQCTLGWANEIEMGEVLVRRKGDHRILPRGGHWGHCQGHKATQHCAPTHCALCNVRCTLCTHTLCPVLENVRGSLMFPVAVHPGPPAVPNTARPAIWVGGKTFREKREKHLLQNEKRENNGSRARGKWKIILTAFIRWWGRWRVTDRDSHSAANEERASWPGLPSICKDKDKLPLQELFYPLSMWIQLHSLSESSFLLWSCWS